MIKNWKTKEDILIDNYKIFELHKVIRITEDNLKEGNFVYLDSPDWVNVIPVTKDNKILLIEQFRHGTNEITLEIPGGMVEPNEDPASAGMRECMEETGYGSLGIAELLGIMTPNPAFLSNKCYSYLWNNVDKLYEQKLDKHEEINVIEATWNEIFNYIKNGKVRHSLVLNAFFFFSLKYLNGIS